MKPMRVLSVLGFMVALSLGSVASADVPPPDSGEPREDGGGCSVGGGGAAATPLVLGAWLLVGRRQRSRGRRP